MEKKHPLYETYTRMFGKTPGGERLNEEGEEQMTTEVPQKLKAIKAMYGDILAFTQGKDQSKARRNLQAVGPELTADELILAVERIIVEYNEFDVSIAKRLVRHFGKDSKYYLTREYSVAVYVEPTEAKYSEIESKVNEDPEYLDDMAAMLNADESSFEDKQQYDKGVGGKKLIRFWWD